MLFIFKFFKAMRMLRARPAFLLGLRQAKLPCENSTGGQGEETLAAYA
jgi:hypothetical protein